MKTEIMRLVITPLFVSICLILSLGSAQKQGEFNLPMQNIVYVGVENPIIIYDADESDSIFAPESVKIKRTENSHEFKLIAYKSLNKLTLEVRNRNGELKSVIELKSVLLPNPKVTLLGRTEGLISANEIAIARKLDVEIPCVSANIEVRIESFMVTIQSANDVNTFENKGALFNGKLAHSLNSLERGSRVLFENIRVRMPNGQIVKVPSVLLKVK